MIDSINSSKALDIPPAWYFVLPSKKLRPGQIHSFQINTLELVIFRGKKDLLPHVLSAHCTHMGVHLKNASIEGDHIKCPLHNRIYTSGGQWMNYPKDQQKNCFQNQMTFSVKEKYGGIFMYFGNEPDYELPHLNWPSGTIFSIGKPVQLNCPWIAIASNGFDAEHFEKVHNREYLAPPKVFRRGNRSIELHYRSRITGRSLGDRFLKWISNNEIRVKVKCFGGPLMLIESDLGFVQSKLLLNIVPTSKNCSIMTPIIIQNKSKFKSWDYLKIYVAQQLFFSFMKKDISMLDGMKFHFPSNLKEDQILNQFLIFLKEQHYNQPLKTTIALQTGA